MPLVHILKNMTQEKNGYVYQALLSSIAGSKAMLVNMSTLMWLNTIATNQHVTGNTSYATFNQLYKQGGMVRFYDGFGITLMHGCIARFGDVFSYSLIKKYTNDEKCSFSSSFSSTVVSATMSSVIRGILTPLEKVKIMRQIDGYKATSSLIKQTTRNGLSSLWNGSITVVGSNFVGYVPWFYTYDLMHNVIPEASTHCTLSLIRDGCIGFSASVVSDVVSNGIRVIKTLKQMDSHKRSYLTLIRNSMSDTNATMLPFRGLSTRIATNGLQSVVFTILWNLFDKN